LEFDGIARTSGGTLLALGKPEGIASRLKVSEGEEYA
jgi:hypothetical protein